jgi:glycosyltransferase involved in cell wall biosynthesis
VLDAIRVVVDAEPRQRERLHALRERLDYEAAFAEDEPLVSVVIPTYDNYPMLRDRALPSVLAQTYERLELIVVGDAAPEETRRVVEATSDPRVSFHNMPMRGPYPDEPALRWLVAGNPAYNEAVRRAKGRWIAPLDDDDAFSPDHVERLLRHARDQRAELAYGVMREHRPDGEIVRRGRFPPRYAQFGLQASIYHAGLAEIFECELSDAVFRVPSDWSMCRRMMRAGVRIAMVDEEVVDLYPSRQWTRWDEPPTE